MPLKINPIKNIKQLPAPIRHPPPPNPHHPGGIAVSEAVDGDARGEVEVLLALGVPHLAPEAVREHGRGAATVRAEDALVLVFTDRIRVAIHRSGRGSRVGDSLRARDYRRRAAAAARREGPAV